MKLRGAVIGVGYLGNFHAQKYQVLTRGIFKDKIEFIGVCDLNRSLAEKIAAELGVQAFSDPKELIGKVDLVSIVTITPKHYEIAKMFLKSGIHVNVEKPMTVKVSEAQELVELAKKMGLILCVGHSERFNPAFRELKDQISKPLYAELNRHAPFKMRGSDVSVVHDLMIHDIDLALSLDKSKVTVDSSEGGRLVTENIDWANCVLNFESGFRVRISVSRLAQQMTRAIKLIETDRIFDVNLQTGEIATTSLLSNEKENPLNIQTKSCGKGDNLFLETEAYFHAVLADSAPVVTGEDGSRALRVAELVLEKIYERQT